ncbi:MAG: protein kinase [Myxococcota bacterium]|nr:protein kinase [Myxococcota bacterium]
MAAVQSENIIGVGTLLAGKYKVGRELGRGGMAAVYEAEHVNIGKKVAIKVLSSELASSAVVIERFFREARAAASVRSPHIVEVYDSGRLEDGRPFIAMELLEGESLYDRMSTVRLIDASTTVRIITQVAKGLTKAHAAGIVHRDLKPENIHLVHGEDGEEIVKILDFGLAKFYSPVKPDEKTARLTREGAVFGTPAYMSPEQVKGQGNVDQRSDLWALGCMAFECLTGRPVWNTDQGVAMTFAAIAASQLPTPSRVRADLPPEFDAWFFKALDRNPDRRFQTARELAEELAKALGTPTAPISLAFLSAPSPMELEAPYLRTDEPAGPRERPGPPSQRAPKHPGPGTSPPPDFFARPGIPGVAPEYSATDLPPTAAPERVSALAAGGGRRASRIIASAVALAAAAVIAVFLYGRVLHPRRPAIPTSTIASDPGGGTASAGRTGVPSPASPALSSALEPPRWMGLVEQGQQLLASGDVEGATRKFRDAVEAGAAPLARSLLEHARAASATNGPCKLAGLSHPRVGYGGAVGRPALAVTSKGAVVAWTDDHERPGHEHVYSVLVDAAGRAASPIRDLTPEADYAMRPALLSVEDRVVLLFWDRSGHEPGVHVRWLDADGRIGGMSAVVAAAKAGLFWPAMDRAPDGTFWVAWQDSPDKEGEDIFLRRLDSELKPSGGEVRVTDYEPEKGKPPRASVPSIAVSSANLFVAYALEHDHQHVIERMRLPLASDWQSGLQPGPKTSRELGEAAVVNEDRVGGEYPSLACAKDACFLVWHEVERGAQAALIDPAKGTILWRKRFDARGGHPAVASGVDGLAEVAFYEGGRVRLAAISRDGVGAMTTLGKVTGDQPRPWIAAGRTRGEWYVSWLDVEAGHTEAFAARLQCRN